MLDGKLRISPKLPKGWDKLRYVVRWKGQKLRVTVTRDDVTLENLTRTSAIEAEVNASATLPLPLCSPP